MNRRFEKRLIFVQLALSAITLAQLALGSLGKQASLTPNAGVTSSASVLSQEAAVAACAGLASTYG